MLGRKESAVSFSNRPIIAVPRHDHADVRNPAYVQVDISFARAKACGLHGVLQQVAENNRQIDRFDVLFTMGASILDVNRIPARSASYA